MSRWVWIVVLCFACKARKEPQPHEVPVAIPVAPAPAVRPQPPFEVPAPTDAIVALARGTRHACVVRASGAVDCWGQPITKRCKGCMTDQPPDPRVRRVPGVSVAVAITADA